MKTKSTKTPSRAVSASSKPTEKKLPVGICETHFYNPEHRENKSAKTARPCFYAYIGGKGRYKAKRFMIDILGREKALREAKKWRREQEREFTGDLKSSAPQSARAASPQRAKKSNR